MKTTPIPVKFDRQGHSCNFYAGFGPTKTTRKIHDCTELMRFPIQSFLSQSARKQWFVRSFVAQCACGGLVCTGLNFYGVVAISPRPQPMYHTVDFFENDVIWGMSRFPVTRVGDGCCSAGDVATPCMPCRWLVLTKTALCRGSTA